MPVFLTETELKTLRLTLREEEKSDLAVHSFYLFDELLSK